MQLLQFFILQYALPGTVVLDCMTRDAWLGLAALTGFSSQYLVSSRRLVHVLQVAAVVLLGPDEKPDARQLTYDCHLVDHHG